MSGQKLGAQNRPGVVWTWTCVRYRVQFVRQLIYEREEISVAELARELRQQGLELTGEGTGLEEALQFLSDNGYAGDGYVGPGQ